MAGKDKGTENHIKETAKRVFFKEGRFNATTQDIA
ncbi:MAG: TetR/AcrR family transcriptional regulator, partial [Sphingobacteriales bacterium]